MFVMGRSHGLFIPFVSFILGCVFVIFLLITPVAILGLVCAIIQVVKVNDGDYNYVMLWTIPFNTKKPYLPPVENIDPIEPIA